MLPLTVAAPARRRMPAPRTAARSAVRTAGTARLVVAVLTVVAAGTLAALAGGRAPLGVGGLTALATGLVIAMTGVNLLRLGAHPFAPSTLFVAALAVFHLGMIAPVSAGLDDAPLWLAALPDDVVAASMLAVVLAFASLEIGLVLGWRRTREPATAIVPLPAAPRGASALHGGGLAVAAAAALASVVNLAAIGFDRFFTASYGYEIFAATDSRLLQMSFFWLLPAAALVAFAGARRGAEARRALALIATTTALLLWAGDRGGAIALLAGATLVWTATRGALPRRLAIGAPLAVLVLVPAIATVRQLPRNALSLASLGEALVEASPLSALTEMGASLRPLAETLRLVPDAEPYRFGRSYLAALARVTPNLGLSRADDGWLDADELAPDLWITYTVAPWTFAAYGGLGYSGIAEPYLNFGALGITAYFLAVGFALGRLELRLARAPSRRSVALAAVIFMSFLLTVRNDIQNFVRPAVWGVAVIALIEVVHGVRPVGRRRAAARGVA